MPYQLSEHSNLLAVNTGRSQAVPLVVEGEDAEMWLCGTCPGDDRDWEGKLPSGK